MARHKKWINTVKDNTRKYRVIGLDFKTVFPPLLYSGYSPGKINLHHTHSDCRNGFSLILTFVRLPLLPATTPPLRSKDTIAKGRFQ
jgi:hypothetical protein